MVTMPPTVFGPLLLLLLLPDEPPPQAPASSAVAASRLMTRSRRFIPFLLTLESFSAPLGMSSCDWFVFTQRPPARGAKAGGRRRGPARSRARWPRLLGGPHPRRAPRPRRAAGTGAAAAARARSA